MTEFDFEELDKAVSGLMSNVDTKKRNPALDDPEDKVVELSLPETPSVAPTPAESQSEPAVETPAPSAASSPALAVKRRGQFMDMVHPSSDMKIPARRPSRQGVTIAPVAPVASETAVTPEQPAAPVFEAAPEPTPAPNPEAFAASIPADASESAPAPLISPFLPDARPEKRPLGSPVVTEQAAIEEFTEAPAPKEPGQSVNDNLPEELSNDVLAVESNDLSNHLEAEVIAADTPVVVEPETAREPIDTETAPVVDVVEPTPEVAPAAPIAEPEEVSAQTPVAVPAGGSIAQQYDETPSTGDQTSGSIYDTASYHQAIDPIAIKKKSSPVKFIFAFVVLLILGVGGGVAYFLLTQ